MKLILFFAIVVFGLIISIIFTKNDLNKNKSIKVLEVEILHMTEETAKLKIRQSCVDWINKNADLTLCVVLA